MKKLFATAMLITAMLITFTGTAHAQSMKLNEEQAKNLAAFPEAKAGMVRHVIFLKTKPNEDKLKVEIIPGKVMSVDCNQHFLMGALEEKDLQGWGYTYFEFNSNGQTRSTMMACNKPNQDKFVSGETKLVRYNSKLPIVVYAPEGYEVKYSIWKAGKEVPAPKM